MTGYLLNGVERRADDKAHIDQKQFVFNRTVLHKGSDKKQKEQRGEQKAEAVTEHEFCEEIGDFHLFDSSGF